MGNRMKFVRPALSRLLVHYPDQTRPPLARSGIAIALILVLLAAAVTVLTSAAAPPAAAAPGNPGTPSDPTVLYDEDFENRPSRETQQIDSYVSATGARYDADPYWKDAYMCNGFVTSLDSTDRANDCATEGWSEASHAQFRQTVKEMVSAISELNGSDPQTNSGVAELANSQAPNGVIFRTVDPIDLGNAGSQRFIAFSVNAAATTCGATQPNLTFSVANSSGAETPLNEPAINPCTQGRELAPNTAINTGPVYGDTFYSSGLLIDGGESHIILRNVSDSVNANGNDFAVDDVRIVDATPQLDKSFSGGDATDNGIPDVPTGGTSTLTFTVTNTSELAAKAGWSFTDDLPEGLIVADEPNLGGTCNATTTASAGDTSIAITDGSLAAGEVSCTITVDVTSASPAGAETSPIVYENCAANIVDPVGVNPPDCAQVEFYSTPKLEITKTSDATAGTRVGDTVTYTVSAANTGDGDFTESDPAVVTDDLSGVLDDASYNGDGSADRDGTLSYDEPKLSWSGALAAGQTVTLTYTVTLTAGGDGTARNIAYAGSPEDETPACDPPDETGTDPETGVPCAENTVLLPRLTIEKSADRTELPAVGEEVTVTVTVTNEGPGDYTADAPAVFTDDLTDVLDSANFDGTATTTTGTVSYSEPTLSWSGALAAGESATTTYTVTYTGEGDQNLRNLACVPGDQTAPGAAACDFAAIPGAGLTQWKQVESSDSPAVAGTVLTYTLFFKNDGEAAADVDAIDDLTHVLDDADITVEPASDDLTVTRDGSRISITGSVPAGETYAVSYTATIRPDGERGDEIAANFLLTNDPENPPETPGSPDCEPADGQFPDCTSTPIAAVSYAKSVEASTDPVDAGTVLTFTITVRNDGTATAPVDREDVLTDVLDDATLTSDPQSDTDTVTVSPVADERFRIGGELAGGATATITYQVTVNAESERGNDSATNFLVDTGAQPPETCDPQSAECTTTPLPNIAVEKTVDPASGSNVQAGQQVTYTLTLSNSGKAAGAVDYTDDLAGVLDDAQLTDGPTVSDPALEASDGSDGKVRVTGSLDAGQTVTVSYTVTVGADGDRGDNQLRNIVAKTGVTDPSCEDTGVSCTENPIGELADWKTVDPASGTTVQDGATLTYTLHFENTGTAPVDVDREDDLTGVLDDAEVTAGPSASSDSLTVSEVVDGRFGITGTLQPGQSETVAYTVTVKADGERGDDRLANFLLDPGQEPTDECAPADGERADCTVNFVNDVAVAKSSDPQSGSEVKPGDEVTYTITFANTSASAEAAPVDVDYTDTMGDVLDDAALIQGPTVSDENLTAVADGSTIRVTGAVPTGAEYTVTYTVTVKDYADQGNGQLGNVVAVTGEAPVCAPDSPLCTEHVVPPEPGEEPPGPGDDPTAPGAEPPAPGGSGGNLPFTGADFTGWKMLLALALIIAGSVLVYASRRRKSGAAGPDQEVSQL